MFARAYAAALDKLDAAAGRGASGDPAAVAAQRGVLQRLLLGVSEELRLHGAYAARWGVDVAAAAAPSGATADYCRFLLGVSRDPASHVAEVLAAMIPCSRLYGFLGCRLAAATGHLAPHAYSEWLETYSGDAYLVRAAGGARAAPRRRARRLARRLACLPACLRPRHNDKTGVPRRQGAPV